MSKHELCSLIDYVTLIHYVNLWSQLTASTGNFSAVAYKSVCYIFIRQLFVKMVNRLLNL